MKVRLMLFYRVEDSGPTVDILCSCTRFAGHSRVHASSCGGMGGMPPRECQSSRPGQAFDFATHHKMSGICLKLVDGLQLIEPRLGCWQIKSRRRLHET